MEKARKVNLAEAGRPGPVSGSSGMTRRRLLGAMAAGTAACLFGRATPALASTDRRIAIVGGGLAGLTALRTFADAGIAARLYEARGRLGGRIFSASGPAPSDDGGQFINSDHEDMLALAQRFGLTLIDRKELDGRTLVIDGDRLVTEAELVEDLRLIAERIAADAEALDADYEAMAPALDALSVKAYLDRHADALTKPYVRALLEATVRTEYGQESFEASALELIFNLPVVDGSHVNVIGGSDERYVLSGGSGSLIRALVEPLMPQIATGRALVAIAESGSSMHLRFADGSIEEADRVILTLPPTVMRTVDFGGMLPEPWTTLAAEIDLSRNEKLNAAYHGRPWIRTMGSSGDCWPLPGGFAEGWDCNPAQGDTGVFTWFMGGDQCAAASGQDPADLRKAFEAQARPALPGMTEAATGWQRRTAWTSDPYARGAYSCFRPGQLTRFASLFWIEEGGETMQRATAGPLIFAGEHVSDAYAGYMNGAAQTGRLAAQTLIQELQ
jgi:monoamine oxidase